MSTSISATQTVQEWGNSLAVRLTAKVARAARLSKGQAITIEVIDGGVFLRPAGKLTLEQKLERFDPAVHGGEVLTGAPVGRERV